MRLDVSVTYTDSMDVGQRPHQLIRVHLYQERRHHLLHLEISLHNLVQSIWNVVHDHVQVDLILFVPISVERLLHLDAVRVMQDLKDLKFSVLIALVLKHFLDGNCFSCFSYSCLIYHSECPVSDDLFHIISETFLNKFKKLYIT